MHQKNPGKSTPRLNTLNRRHSRNRNRSGWVVEKKGEREREREREKKHLHRKQRNTGAGKGSLGTLRRYVNGAHLYGNGFRTIGHQWSDASVLDIVHSTVRRWFWIVAERFVPLLLMVVSGVNMIVSPRDPGNGCRWAVSSQVQWKQQERLHALMVMMMMLMVVWCWRFQDAAAGFSDTLVLFQGVRASFQYTILHTHTHTHTNTDASSSGSHQLCDTKLGREAR